MNPRALTGIVLASMFVFLGRPNGQEPSATPRQSILAGTTVEANNSLAPIARATLTLAPLNRSTLPIRTISDQHGGFSFANLAAGRYILTASKSGFVDQPYGSKIGQPPAVVVIKAAESKFLEPIALSRGGVVSGLVLSPSGTPVAGVRVDVFATVETSREIAGVQSAVTDDSGHYRVYGLASGSYAVAATPTAASPLFGILRSNTPSELEWLESQKSGSLTGITRTLPPFAAAVDSPSSFQRVFFGDTVDFSLARLVTVEPMREVSLEPIRLRSTRFVTVQGVATGSGGQAISGVSVQLGQELENEFLGTQPTVAGSPASRTDANGHFTFFGVPEGRYVVSGVASGAEGRRLYGSSSVDATQAGAEVQLMLEPSMTVTGGVALAATSSLPIPRGIRIALVALSPSNQLSPPAFSGISDGEGHFQIDGVPKGRYQVGVSGLPPRSTLEAVVFGGREVQDGLIDLTAAALGAQLSIRLTDRPAGIAGTVFDQTGQPASDVSVVVFSTERASWFADSHRVRSVQTSADGGYEVLGLPEGDYWIVSAAALDIRKTLRPVGLLNLVALAVKVRVNRGVVSALALQVH